MSTPSRITQPRVTPEEAAIRLSGAKAELLAWSEVHDTRSRWARRVLKKDVKRGAVALLITGVAIRLLGKPRSRGPRPSLAMRVSSKAGTLMLLARGVAWLVQNGRGVVRQVKPKPTTPYR